MEFDSDDPEVMMHVAVEESNPLTNELKDLLGFCGGLV